MLCYHLLAFCVTVSFAQGDFCHLHGNPASPTDTSHSIQYNLHTVSLQNSLKIQGENISEMIHVL